MTWRCLALLSVLLSPAAFANCQPPPFLGDYSGVSATIEKNDRRELESLLGQQIDDVVCGRLDPWRPIRGMFQARRGYLVLTANELLFVSDRKRKEILFRVDLAAVRALSWFGFETAFAGNHESDVLLLLVVTDDRQIDLHLTCKGGAGRLADELALRTATNPGIRVSRPGGRSASAVCG